MQIFMDICSLELMQAISWWPWIPFYGRVPYSPEGSISESRTVSPLFILRAPASMVSWIFLKIQKVTWLQPAQKWRMFCLEAKRRSTAIYHTKLNPLSVCFRIWLLSVKSSLHPGSDEILETESLEGKCWLHVGISWNSLSRSKGQLLYHMKHKIMMIVSDVRMRAKDRNREK